MITGFILGALAGLIIGILGLILGCAIHYKFFRGYTLHDGLINIRDSLIGMRRKRSD